MRLTKKLALPDFTEDQSEAIANLGNPLLEDNDFLKEKYIKDAFKWLFLCELWCSPVFNPK